MNATEKRQLETEVMRTGLAGLADLKDGVSDFVQVIAKIVNGWQTCPNRHGEWIDKHKFLRDLLSECAPADRGEMYSAIVPHLAFAALPLARYESMMTERIGALASKGAARVEGQAPAPVSIGGKKYVQAPAGVATHAIATLHCQRCWKKKRFLADTPAGAMILARKAGWERFPDSIKGKETCPKCVKKLMELKVIVN